MWPMIAEPGLRCAECRHTIQPGRLCLSELPEETPAGVSRSDFENYCVGCPECWKQGRHACYVRNLEAGVGTGNVPRNLPCARCGRRIRAGDKAGIQAYYDWPEALGDQQRPAARGRYAGAASLVGAAAVATGVDVLVRGVPSGSFADLSGRLQQKFVNAGLGSERGFRTLAEAQSFYHDSVPYQVRNLDEDAVWQFLSDKQAAHKVSWSNNPDLGRDSNNLIWQNKDINHARGRENMPGLEEFGTQATNAFHASAIVFRECMTTAAMSAFYAALLEAPVAAAENIIHHGKGRKSGEDAIRDASIAIGKRAGQVAVVGFAVTAAVALIPGAAPLLVTIAPVLMPVGMALYGYTAIKRIMNALDDGIPLNRLGIYFCTPRCQTTFAYETGRSALMRWEANRVESANSGGLRLARANR